MPRRNTMLSTIIPTKNRPSTNDTQAAMLNARNAQGNLASAVALLARLPWALRALSIAAWVSFVLGLFLVGMIVLSMVFLRGIHGEVGIAALAISGLILAL